MRRTTLTCAPFFACFLFGCTDLEVFRLPTDDTGPIQGGMSYYLPRSAITLTGTVTLSKCDPARAPGDPKFIEVSASVTPVISTEADPDYHYFISYEKARSWMKEINYSVNNNANGTLQSFNTTINDQAGPIIVAAIGAAAQIGGAVGLGLVPRPGFAPQLTAEEIKVPKGIADNCSQYLSDDAYKALQTIIEQKKLKKTYTDAPAVGAAEAAAQAQAAQEAQSKIDAANKTLTRSFSFKWLPSLRDSYETYDELQVLDKKIDFTPMTAKWFNLAMYPKFKPPASPPIHIMLEVQKSTMGKPGINDAADPSHYAESDGLIIRDPASATLRICKEADKACTSRAAIQVSNRLVDTTDDSTPRMALKLPQFGRVMVLTSKSGLFENSVLNATLNADGTIATIGFHYSNTLATGLSGLGTAASTASSAIAAQNTAIAARNTATAAMTTATTANLQAPDTYNKALADCLTQRAAIIKAGGTPVACQ
jgi:hypothetical protein